MNTHKSSKQKPNESSNILRDKQKALENLARKLIQSNNNKDKQHLNDKIDNK